ncbi:MAG: hypothetical protein ACT4P4_16375 [Betaproteobacteria bacterium]
MKAEETVRAYLDAMERRDLAAAQSFLAPGFHMTFPGDQQFSGLRAGLPHAPRRRKA